MARVLAAEELDEEAREALLDAVPLLGRALAIEKGLLPGPADAREAVGGPWLALWGAAIERLRVFVERTDASVRTTIAALESSGCLP